MRRLTVLLPAAGVAACIAAAAPSSASLDRAVVVEAEMRYAAGGAAVRLVVERGARRVFAARVQPYSGRFRHMRPVERHGRKPITLLDLDRDREPEIVLDFFWGGAHCCFWSRIYRWDRAHGTYRNFRHLWGNVLYGTEDLEHDGTREFVAADDRFAYEFASFAESALPVRIWSYRPHGLAEATRSYPARVAYDAERQWRRYRSARAKAEKRSALAAWAADECLLGRADEALARVRSLSPALSEPGRSAAAYLRQLHALLRRTGYLR